jgi:hypothetical protein
MGAHVSPNVSYHRTLENGSKCCFLIIQALSEFGTWRSHKCIMLSKVAHRVTTCAPKRTDICEPLPRRRDAKSDAAVARLSSSIIRRLNTCCDCIQFGMYGSAQHELSRSTSALGRDNTTKSHIIYNQVAHNATKSHHMAACGYIYVYITLSDGS